MVYSISKILQAGVSIMKKVFSEPAELEKIAKEKYCVPEFIMMEHAANFMKDFILKIAEEKNLSKPSVLIICGKGNNGGDGYALARLLADHAEVSVFQLFDASGKEAITQATMCQKLNIPITDKTQAFNQLSNLDTNNFQPDFIVDCIFGTGFRPPLSAEIKALLDTVNSLSSIKIACDIPSALYFKADYTITMGQLKTVLFSDTAKNVCGKILTAPLGLPTEAFESGMDTKLFLIEKADVKLPLRKEKASHKGSYGHTAVIAGKNSGAAILSATAALNFGSGLTSLVKTQQSNLEQFKVSPELMISNSIPEKTTCIAMGSGIDFKSEGKSNSAVDNIDTNIIIETFTKWFCNKAKNLSVVLDAGFFDYDSICPLLEKLNSVPDAKIVLTPHLSELNRFLQKVSKAYPEVFPQDIDISVKNLAENPQAKIKIGQIINKIYPQTVLVMKSANTFIAAENQIFICTDGCQNLAKGGSGDILAGMTAALLSQGYSAKEATITACESHALASKAFGEENYDLSPLKLIASV